MSLIRATFIFNSLGLHTLYNDQKYSLLQMSTTQKCQEFRNISLQMFFWQTFFRSSWLSIIIKIWLEKIYSFTENGKSQRFALFIEKIYMVSIFCRYSNMLLDTTIPLWKIWRSDVAYFFSRQKWKHNYWKFDSTIICIMVKYTLCENFVSFLCIEIL